MILISKLTCTLIYLCILVTVVLNGPLKTNPIVETMLDDFINSLHERNCVIPSSIILPSYPKMNPPRYDFETPSQYDLGIPLEICLIPVSLKSSSDFRPWKLCDEVFKVMINMSSCKLTKEKIESIKYNISISVSDDSCKDYRDHKTIFPTDEKYLASKLTDEMVCRLVCDGELFEKACSFLLWAYQVQHKLVAETSFITQNISQQQKSNSVEVTTLSITPSQENADGLTAQPENATAYTNDTQNEISEEAKPKEPPQGAKSSLGKIRVLNENEKKNRGSDTKSKTHSVIKNQTETKNENSHPDFNAVLNGTSSVGKMKSSININAKDNTDSKTKIIPAGHSEKNEKINSSSENLTDTLLVKKVSSIANSQLNNESKTSVSSMKVTNVISYQGSQNTADTKSSTLSKGKFADKKVENAQTLANTASPVPNEEIAVEKMESDNNEIPLPPGDEQEHYIDTENEGDIEGEFPRSEYDSSNNDAENDENQKIKPDQSVDHQLNDMPGDDEDHIPVITESGSDRIQDEAIDTQVITRNRGAFPDQEDNHFFFYFLSIIVVCIAGYLVFHNKQKIIALIIEGRHERRRRSSSHGVNYKKLEAK